MEMVEASEGVIIGLSLPAMIVVGEGDNNTGTGKEEGGKQVGVVKILNHKWVGQKKNAARVTTNRVDKKKSTCPLTTLA